MVHQKIKIIITHPCHSTVHNACKSAQYTDTKVKNLFIIDFSLFYVSFWCISELWTSLNFAVWRVRELSNFSLNIFICVLKINKDLGGLKCHTFFFFFLEYIIFKFLFFCLSKKCVHYFFVLYFISLWQVYLHVHRLFFFFSTQ